MKFAVIGVGGVGGVVGELPPSPHAVSSTTAANAWNLNFSVFLNPRYLMADNMQRDSYFSLVGGGSGWMICAYHEHDSGRTQRWSRVDGYGLFHGT